MTHHTANRRVPHPTGAGFVIPLLCLAAALTVLPAFAQSADSVKKDKAANDGSSDDTIKMDTYVVTGY